ncbi:minimal PKS chain-length factor (CLF/KS beta) [Saccharopolyspora antimicrobica]|uniref:Minimal PKS chain-length factor (CLF/KS beta) n=1 Tax=Saccharopolyspora antimicrobica TaxID=455193 RepID=A0A1I5GSB5_9PSEU|nr:minimal PKS chain-length factor (CLF/KS beta) [Saccharopolyspora antimicrobica]SFO38471.1 minimal PKS chain-length factor (CLF/KS beta) [Saccharopolyspora antimicrobica]
MNSTPVITGLGVVAPNGIGADEFWRALRDGRPALGPLTRFEPNPYPVKVAGQVVGFDSSDWIDPRVVVQTDRFTHFGLAAAELALRDADLDPAVVPPLEFGVVTASFSAGVEFGQQEIQQLWRHGPEHVGPYQSIAWFYAATTGQISIGNGLRGPCGVLVADEAGGLDVLASARDDVRRGAAMLAGGTEAPLSPYAVCAQLGFELLSPAADPTAAYLPFTSRAGGFIPGEGGAMLVVESARAARRRGARARAAIAGHGATFTGPRCFDQSAEGLERAARLALSDAGVEPSDVDVVFLDALGDPEADRAEERALRWLLGDRANRIPVTAPKTGYGRCYAGAAALDVATAALAIEHGIVPPTPNIRDCPFDLDLVAQARPADINTVLVLARGLHGGNSALVLRSPASTQGDD